MNPCPFESDKKKTPWRRPAVSVIKAYVKSMKLRVRRTGHVSHAELVEDLVTISEEGIKTQVLDKSIESGVR